MAVVEDAAARACAMALGPPCRAESRDGRPPSGGGAAGRPHLALQPDTRNPSTPSMTWSETSACRLRWLHIGCRSVGLPGRIIEGWFIPDVPGPQWCDPDVLRLIKLVFRGHAAQIEPVRGGAGHIPPAPAGHRQRAALGCVVPTGAPLAPVRVMAGVPVPASASRSRSSPYACATGYTAGMLDELNVGRRGPLDRECTASGGRWIALAPADVGFLLPRSSEAPTDLVALELLELLRSGGGWFVGDLRNLMTSPASFPVISNWRSWSSSGWIRGQRHDRACAGHAGWLPRRRRRSTAGVLQRSRRPARGRDADLWRRPPGEAVAGTNAWWWKAFRDLRPPGAPRLAPGLPPELPGRWFALPDATPGGRRRGARRGAPGPVGDRDPRRSSSAIRRDSPRPTGPFPDGGVRTGPAGRRHPRASGPLSSPSPGSSTR